MFPILEFSLALNAALIALITDNWLNRAGTNVEPQVTPTKAIATQPVITHSAPETKERKPSFNPYHSWRRVRASYEREHAKRKMLTLKAAQQLQDFQVATLSSADPDQR